MLFCSGDSSWTCHAAGTTTVSPMMLRWQQFYGLLVKRFHHGRRNIKSLTTNILLPGIFVSIAMTVALAQPKADTYPPLVLSPSMFHPPPYYVPFNNYKEDHSNFSYLLENSLKMPSGIGADCVLKFRNTTLQHFSNMQFSEQILKELFDPFCAQRIHYSDEDLDYRIKKDVWEGNITSKKGSTLPTCHCEQSRWEFVCDPGVEGNPQYFSTVTQDTMINITNRNFKRYLQYTNNRFKRKR